MLLDANAKLRFVPAAKLESAGYGAFLPAFREAGLVPDAVSASAAGSAGDAVPEGAEVALLAGGCYWGMEDLVRDLPGVIARSSPTV